ncbi:hypothetical protein K474DRAFT_1680821 [Panus rudis PR-1116 ss-1]|nr:hypothetical protein K474DRAFT_1680821 [Panus rudis PR-1116 ss-1]
MRLFTLLPIALMMLPAIFALPFGMAVGSQASVSRIAPRSNRLEARGFAYGGMSPRRRVPLAPPTPKRVDPNARAVAGTGRYEGLKVYPNTQLPVTGWDKSRTQFYALTTDGTIVPHPDNEALKDPNVIHRVGRQYASTGGVSPEKYVKGPDGKLHLHPVYNPQEYHDVNENEWNSETTRQQLDIERQKNNRVISWSRS